MEVICTKDISRPGNDCYIKESYSIIEQFGLYAVIRVFKVNGWSDIEDISIVLTTSNLAEAEEKLEDYCKYYKG